MVAEPSIMGEWISPQEGHGHTGLSGLTIFLLWFPLLHYLSLVWCCVLFCMWPCMLLVRCVSPSLLPQRMPAASLAPQSTMPCVALGVSWAAASHTRQWCPSTLSSVACRFVRKLHYQRAAASLSAACLMSHLQCNDIVHHLLTTIR